MAELTINVREKSRPTVDFADVTAWKDKAGRVVDITGWTLKLVVKRLVTDPDSQVLFDLTGTIVTATEGAYRFTLDLSHTAFPPGTYPAEVRVWTAAPGSNPPNDAKSVDFIIEPAIKLSEV
jgi:hypothetical protein